MGEVYLVDRRPGHSDAGRSELMDLEPDSEVEEGYRRYATHAA